MLNIVRGNGPQPPENTQLWACASRLRNYKTGEGLQQGSLQHGNLHCPAARAPYCGLHSITIFCFSVGPSASASPFQRVGLDTSRGATGVDQVQLKRCQYPC